MTENDNNINTALQVIPETSDILPAKRKRGKASMKFMRNGKIDVARLLVLRYAKKLPYQECADLLGVSKSAVIQKCQSLPTPEAVDDYQINKVKVLTAAELSMVSLLSDPVKQAKASLNNAAYAFTQLHSANRLESGLSTSIVAYADMVKAREILKAEQNELKQAGSSQTDI